MRDNDYVDVRIVDLLDWAYAKGKEGAAQENRALYDQLREAKITIEALKKPMITVDVKKPEVPDGNP